MRERVFCVCVHFVSYLKSLWFDCIGLIFAFFFSCLLLVHHCFENLGLSGLGVLDFVVVISLAGFKIWVFEVKGFWFRVFFLFFDHFQNLGHSGCWICFSYLINLRAEV